MPKQTDKEKLRADFPAPEGSLEENKYITPTLTRGLPPEQYRLPTLDSMRDMSRAELTEMLRDHFGVTGPWGALQASASQYLTRLTQLQGEAFQRELERITTFDDEDSGAIGRGLLGLSRRVVQQWSSWDAIDGDINKEMVWITEMDERVCEECGSRGGQIMTFAEWQESGTPGSAVCLGGDMCRCDLVVVD